MAEAAAPSKPFTKTEILANIADATDLSKQEVAAVFDALAAQIKKSLDAQGPGIFTIPGLLKIERKSIPAREAKQGVPNPFKPGELMDVAARPASNKVKVRPLKKLKDMV
jgi:nucleoid DNA-binding protein